MSIPLDSGAFMQQLEAFYARTDALLHIPQVMQPCRICIPETLEICETAVRH